MEYPFSILPAHDIRYKDNVDINLRLDTYYNYIFNFIPNNEWFIKVDDDHLYNPKALQLAIKQIKSSYDVIYLPYINMHYKNNELFFIKNGFRGGEDNWIAKKVNGVKFNFDFKNGYEVISFNRNQKLKKAENIVSLHFPYIKQQRSHMIADDMLIPFDDFDLNSLHLSKIDIDFLNKDKIAEYMRNNCIF